MVGCFDTAFGYHQRATVIIAQQIDGGRNVSLERMQVAIVDADEERVKLARAAELLFVMHLDQGSQAKFASESSQSSQFVLFQHGSNEQYAVSPSSACFVQLVLVENKILAQNGQVDCGAHCRKVSKCTLEMAIGQYRYCCCTTLRIFVRNRDGVQAGKNITLAWRCALHFGDDCRVAFSQGSGKVAGYGS